MFQRSNIKRYQEEEELNSQLIGTGMEARKNQELEETMREARQAPNTGQTELRRSSRLARKG